MSEFEISEKIQAVAESVGLSEEEVQNLLTGGGDIPQELSEVFGRISDLTAEFFDED